MQDITINKPLHYPNKKTSTSRYTIPMTPCTPIKLASSHVYPDAETNTR